MGSSRQILTLGDLGTIKTGKTPSTKVPKHFGGKIPFVTPRDMDGRKRIVGTERYLTEKGARAVGSAVIPAGSIMVSCIGSDMGKVAIAGRECVTNQQINSIVVAEEYASEYVYYDLSQRKSELRSMASGSAQPILNKGHFSQVAIEIPDFPEQRAIAHILGSLDDKIELNHRMNKALEATARAIFKSWFVDFDPVRVKAEGGDPGLPNDVAALFPDSFEDSKLGEIPRGWKVSEIKDCCIKIQNGGTPKRNEPDYWKPGTIPWLTSGEVRQTLITETENKISELGFAKSSAKWLPKDSTVVALYGATAGQVALISSDMTTNQAVCGLIPKTGFRYFNYLYLDRSVGLLSNLARGSAQQNISKGIVETTKIILPKEDIITSFDQVIFPFFNKWVTNLEESKTLASLRDTLLPKLISGELRVPEAEKYVEEAGV